MNNEKIEIDSPYEEGKLAKKQNKKVEDNPYNKNKEPNSYTLWRFGYLTN